MTRQGLTATLPNLLSLSRLGMAIAFPLVPPDWRLGVVVAAGLSDLVDGALGRALHATSALGRLLDPIADKLFVASVLLTMLAEGRIAVWQLGLVGARDLVVSVGCAWLIARWGWSALGDRPPNLLGKMTTAAQFVFLLVVAATGAIVPAVFLPTAVLSLLAAIVYVRENWSEGTAGPGHTPSTP